jgi:hypothetical protein
MILEFGFIYIYYGAIDFLRHSGHLLHKTWSFFKLKELVDNK